MLCVSLASSPISLIAHSTHRIVNSVFVACADCNSCLIICENRIFARSLAKNFSRLKASPYIFVNKYIVVSALFSLSLCVVSSFCVHFLSLATSATIRINESVYRLCLEQNYLLRETNINTWIQASINTHSVYSTVAKLNKPKRKQRKSFSVSKQF